MEFGQLDLKVIERKPMFTDGRQLQRRRRRYTHNIITTAKILRSYNKLRKLLVSNCIRLFFTFLFLLLSGNSDVGLY